MSSNESQKLYMSSTHKLDEELYDRKPEGLYQFLQSLNNRAQEYGWNDEVGGILHIPEDPLDANSDTYYLIDTYGVISSEQTRQFDETYLNLPIDPAQDAYMMFKCLMNSISKEGKTKMNPYLEKPVHNWNSIFWKPSAENYNQRKSLRYKCDNHKHQDKTQ
jgi:hypothetical protein